MNSKNTCYTLIFNVDALINDEENKAPLPFMKGAGHGYGTRIPKYKLLGYGILVEHAQFLLLPQCFQPIPKRISPFKLHLFCNLQMPSIWTMLKFCRLVKS